MTPMCVAVEPALLSPAASGFYGDDIPRRYVMICCASDAQAASRLPFSPLGHARARRWAFRGAAMTGLKRALCDGVSPMALRIGMQWYG
jgi:hypothetical protein